MTLGRWRARVRALVSSRPIRMALAVLARYDAAGGALLAGGLAYSALFAMVPLAFVTAGVAGLIVADAGVREHVIRTITAVMPPLRGLIVVVLGEAARSATTISILGGATLIWGGSRFIVAFETAMSRVTGGPRTRGLLERNLIGVATATLLVVTVILSAVLAGVAAFLDAAAATDQVLLLSLATRVVLGLLPVGLSVAAMVLVYRFVPESRPSWHSTLVPAVTIALLLTIAARAFVFIVPRLIGAASSLGTLATAFAALAWLGLTFQAILIGAAWVGERQDGAGPARG